MINILFYSKFQPIHLGNIDSVTCLCTYGCECGMSLHYFFCTKCTQVTGKEVFLYHEKNWRQENMIKTMAVNEESM